MAIPRLALRAGRALPSQLMAARGASRPFASSSSSSSSRNSRGKARYFPYATAATVAALATSTAIYADSMAETTTDMEVEPSIQRLPASALLRSYLVYTFCSFSTIVDHSSTILKMLTNSPIPGLAPMAEFVVRHTFFAQFCGGEDAQDCKKVMRSLRDEGKACLLSYSVEADEDEVTGDLDSHGEKGELMAKHHLEEYFRAVEALGDFEDETMRMTGHRAGTWVAVKLTGLVPSPSLLYRASITLQRLRPLQLSNSASSPASGPALPVPYPGTSTSGDAQVVNSSHPENESSLMALKGRIEGDGVLEHEEGIKRGDLVRLKVLHDDLRRLIRRAEERNVTIVMDAEHSWYQPAIDAYTMLLAQEFNQHDPQTLTERLTSSGSHAGSRPVVYGTHQAYLARQPGHLEAQLKHASENNYILGIKLVRGAYHEQEQRKWQDEKRAGRGPIWPTKEATDSAYNSSLKTLISTLATELNSVKPKQSVAVLFGTHNKPSCELALDMLVETGLASKIAGTEDKLRLKEGVRGRVLFGQLYGMSDELTDYVAERFEPNGEPMALKYVAYGGLRDVLPYLGRRAIENKAILSGEGGAKAEKARIVKELKRRWLWA